MIWKLLVVAFIVRDKAKDAPIDPTVDCVIRILCPGPLVLLDGQFTGRHQLSRDDRFTNARRSALATDDSPDRGDLAGTSSIPVKM